MARREDIDAAWREEIARRVQQVRDGEVELEPWDDVRRQAREALARRSGREKPD